MKEAAKASGSIRRADLSTIRSASELFAGKELEILEPLDGTTGAAGSFGKPGVYKIPE
jgi:hypothetical protein